jgi:hypothetical protein
MYVRDAATCEFVIRFDARSSFIQSGIMTARRSSCTDTPLELASPCRIWKVFSVREAMNFVIRVFILAPMVFTPPYLVDED